MLQNSNQFFSRLVLFEAAGRCKSIPGQEHTGQQYYDTDREVHGVHPLVQGDMRPFEDGSCTNGEVQFAGIATVVTILARRDPVLLCAYGACWTIRPQS